MGQLITDNHVSCNNNNKQTNNAAIFLGQTAGKPYQNSTILDFIGAKGDGGGEWWQLELWVVQSSGRIVTATKPTANFFSQSALSEHWREN